MPRFRLDLSYDGTDFAGWWRDPHQRTVAGCCDSAFARLGEADAAVVGASRTDAGVHAQGQVAHVDCQRDWEPADLHRALSSQFPDDIACTAVNRVAGDWHCVHASTGKTYSYRIDAGAVRNPLRHRLTWRPPCLPPLASLQEIAKRLPGTWDLAGFQRRGDHRDDATVVITNCTWAPDVDELICQLRADRFVYRLVRSLVGGMIAIANKQCPIEELDRALQGAASQATDFQAPAQGLCLEVVHY